MSDLWNSPRQALGYYYSARKGPTWRQPRYTNTSASTGHHHLDHVMVGAILHGPESEGGCGVEPGSDIDDELEEWALDRDALASDRVRDVLELLNQRLREHGLKSEVPVPDRGMFVRWVYEDGTSGLRMR